MVDSGDWVETYTGESFRIQNLNDDIIKVEDIAHALSNMCRFGGHCQNFYSVAQHAVLTSVFCKCEGFDVETQWAALHHDDGEAYLVDVPRPIKALLPDYKALEKKLDKFLEQHFKFQKTSVVVWADNWLLDFERRMLLKYQPWPELEAFLIQLPPPNTPNLSYLANQYSKYSQRAQNDLFWLPGFAESSYLQLHNELSTKLGNQNA